MEKKRNVLKKLREWRDNEARRSGVELFRILSNETINLIAEQMPATKDALLEVKGIAEKKFQKYGRDILAIVGSEVNGGLFGAEKTDGVDDDDDTVTSPQSSPLKRRGGTTVSSTGSTSSPQASSGRTDGSDDGYRQSGEKIFSVSDYLEILNVGLRQFEAKVVGEISSLDIRGNYLFFGLKDKDGSTMSCFMWASNYRMSGVQLEEGLEVMIGGFPKIHKPSGRISFEANTVELVGEGALKKAYDELKKKLEKEGLFSEARKKQIPEYPQRIGLITSSTGAVIHDFLNNIGKFGFKILFRDSHVEGALAVKELLTAVKYFKKRGGIDVLVMIRGGGSLESLQAFNNEMLVREIADCPFPVIVGIGHDKDVPIVSLVADKACSTPTAVAKALNYSWDQAISKVRLAEQKLLNRFSSVLFEKKSSLQRLSPLIEKGFKRLLERFRTEEERFKRNIVTIGFTIARLKEKSSNFKKITADKIQGALKLVQERASIYNKTWSSKVESGLRHESEKISYLEKSIALNSPMRQIKLGYTIAMSKGKIVRRKSDVSVGDEIDIRVSDGEIKTKAI